MSLQPLADEFKQQASQNNGNITVNAASFTKAGLSVPADLDVLLTAGYQLAADSSLLIDTSGATINDPVGNTLTITGVAGVLQVEASNTAVSFVVTDDGQGNVQFVIVITLSNWTFATSWPFMVGGIYSDLPYTHPTLIFSSAPQSQYVWQQNEISLVGGQNFASLIQLTGILAPLVNFLIGWLNGTQIALSGKLDPSKVNNDTILYPEMDLKVELDVQVIPFSFLTVKSPAIGFKIETVDDTETEARMIAPNAAESTLVLYEEEEEEDSDIVQLSSLYFELQLLLGTTIQMDFSTSVTPDQSTYFLGVTPDPSTPLTPLNLFSLMAGNNWFTILPPTLQQYLNAIAFKGFATTVSFNNGFTIESASATVGSTKPWVLFENFIIKEFDVTWLIIGPGPGKINSQLIHLNASVDFFPKIFQGGFDVEITSDLTLSASFEGSVTFNDLIKAITKDTIDIPPSLLLVEFTSFGMAMDINNKYYEFYANTNINLNFITNISVTNGSLKITSSTPTSGTGESVFTAAVNGLFAIGGLQLNVDVNYSSAAAGGWNISIAMPAGKTLDLGALIKQLFDNIDLPDSFLPDYLKITQFSLVSYVPNEATGTSTYEVKTAIVWKFIFPIINQPINILANLRLQYTSTPSATGDPVTTYEGAIAGTVTLEYFNAEVNIGYDFKDNNQLLSIQWEGFITKYDVTESERTITFHIEKWSVGSLITSFMKMMGDPTFELDSPWDLLNDLSLDGFFVTYNLDTKEITVEYKFGKSLNLIFITINGIRLTKNLDGVFISFDGSSPVPGVNDSNLFKPAKGGQDINKMPEVPGQGSEYFGLYLLAMGQHVELKNSASYQSIKEVTDAMQKAFTEPEPGTIPIGPDNSLLTFNEDSNWLIATSFGVLNVGTKDKPVWTVDAQIVFNDPNLYGLRIALSGDKAKVLKGLVFEIMYKKISDSIGVYQMDLTLPDKLRNLQFGAVNITLPCISLEIYTNGDFKVDIGFPHNMDFSRSFTLQAIVPPGIPAMGSGGLYFGKLSSATTTLVPATSYGNFNPVLVFGIGLQVGVGYSVDYGILSAGFSLTLFGIIEGIIASYHPYQGTLEGQEKNLQTVETSYYYYLKGTVGIIGKLYGSIDFGIISASVNITITIYVQAIFEAYNKIPLAIVASVDVRVSARLNLGLFKITIHFSFTATIRQDLTIGTDNRAAAPWNKDLTVASAVSALAMPQYRMMAAKTGRPRLQFNTMLTTESNDALPVLNLYFVPHLTVSAPKGSNNLASQQAQYVATLFIDAPDPNGPSDGTTSFERMSSDFFRWLVANYIDPNAGLTTRAEIDAQGISKLDLDNLIALLSNEDNPFPIPTADILTFLQSSFAAVNLQNLGEDLPSAAIFPMFYDLSLNVPGIPLSIDFSQYNMATAEYLEEVKKWFAELEVSVSEESNSAPQAKMADAAEPSYSMSTFVFEDYFVLIGKQLAGYGSDAMNNFTYKIDSADDKVAVDRSLQTITTWANSLTANGYSNHVILQDIAVANQNHPLTAGVSLQITGHMHLIASGDTFSSVAMLYAVTSAMLIVQNGTTPGLLAPGQVLKYGDNSYTVKAGDTLEAVATGLNTTLALLAEDPVFQETALTQPGGWLIVGAAVYTAKNEDTFTSVVTNIYKNVDVEGLLMQNQVTPGLFIAGNTFVYNSKPYKILPGDTLTLMAKNISDATHTTVTPENLAADPVVQSLNIQPLGQLLIPPFNYSAVIFEDPAQADTLLNLSVTYSTTVALMASNYSNQIITDLFYNGEGYSSANIPGLEILDVSSLLAYFTENGCYGQLSGMASRYQLHGMRLPTDLPGLTLSAGSPCPADSDCALFSLTGQEFVLPADVAKGFEIQLINSSLSWLQIDGKSMNEPGGNMLSVILDDPDIEQISTLLNYAQQTGIKPEVLSLTPMKPYDLLPLQYTFQTVTKWQSSGKVVLPYGSMGNQNDISPLIWMFPSGMLAQLALPKLAGSMFGVQIGQYDAAKGIMDYRSSSYYGWNTIVEIDLKRLTGESTAVVNAYTYELMGADEAGATILQRLLQALDPNSGNNNKGMLTDIQWLYEADGGLMSVGMDSMKSFIVQANLSTETNPSNQAMRMALMAVEETTLDTGILNSTYDFIRLLWECSITRSGGYYLLYNEIESNKGFPDSIFGKGDTATIRLMLNYSDAFANKPSNYMNCAVTGDKIDVSSCVVYAESAEQKGLIVYPQNALDTPAIISSRYNILLSEFAAINANVVLNTTIAPVPVITFSGLVYEVGRISAVNNLATISAYYSVSTTGLQDLNRQITDWNNLPLWQLVNIPDLKYTVSNAAGTPGNTFGSIAAYYFIDMSVLGWAVRNVANLFGTSTALTINDQILHKVSNVPQGAASFELNRTNPVLPENYKVTDPDYAKIYLDNLYNLLSYNVIENADFGPSEIGLPAGPGTSQTQDQLLGKADATPIEEELWVYNPVIPLAQFAKPNTYMELPVENPAGYPAGYPQKDENPYLGIGGQAQVHFDWVDYYGNNTITPFSDPSLDPQTPLNNPPVQIAYTDELKGLGKWPSLELSYLFDNDNNTGAELALNFNFNSQRYVPLDVPADQQQDWKANARNDLIIYTNIYYQITQLSPKDGHNTLSINLSTSLTPNKDYAIAGAQFNQLLQFVKDTYTYLLARSNEQDATPPVMNPIVNPINAADIDTASILLLSVDVEFARDLDFVNNDFKDSDLVTNSVTSVKPQTIIALQESDPTTPSGTQDTQTSPNGLNEFAAKFELAFSNPGVYQLKIAIGTNPEQAGSSSSNQAVYVVRMGQEEGQGIYWSASETCFYQLTPQSIENLDTKGNVPADVTDKLTPLLNIVYDNRTDFDVQLKTVLTEAEFEQYHYTIYVYSLLPVFYAPKPLNTSLVSKNGVPIQKYVTGKGLVDSSVELKNFAGIDMDNWAEQSLNVIDVFLTSDFSVPGFLVDQLKADDEKIWLGEQQIDADTFVEAITNAKKSLADTISNEIETILTAPVISDDPESLANAREQFKQQLLNQLGNAYNVSALVQTKVTATSDFVGFTNNTTPPRLYGVPMVDNPAFKGVYTLNQDMATPDSNRKSMYSISTAKVQLNAKDASSEDSYLTFSFSTKNAKEYSSVELNLSYVVTHLEFQISDVPGIEGYKGSNWLTFIIPADVNTPVSPGSDLQVLQQNLGLVDIPIVLRNYPTPPTLTTQTGTPVDVSGDTENAKLEKASQWNYTYSYTEDQAAQDRIFSEIEFNLVPVPQLKMMAGSSRDLFNDMAQLVTVWPQILDDFNKYLTAITAASTSSDPNLDSAYYALQALVTLTNNLSIAWSEYTSVLLTSGGDTTDTKRAFDFMIVQTDDEDNDNRLLVTIVPPDEISEQDKLSYTGNSLDIAVTLPNMPVVSIPDYTTVPATDEGGKVIPNAYWYQTMGENPVYLSWIASLSVSSRKVNVNELNILAFQYAWAGLSIIRNEDLIPYNPTNPQFIYRTPLVKFSNKLVPILNNDYIFDIAELMAVPTAPHSLGELLANFFAVFFAKDELDQQLIKLSATWNYPILQSESIQTNPLVLPAAIQLPILLAPPFNFSIPADFTIPSGGCSATVSPADSFVCKLSAAIKTWYGQNNPTTANAWIQLDVSVFSSLTEVKLPLIELKNIILFYKDINDLT
nr:LysM peptidoglycan-binding domain-containing protein [uncultured Pedobacter sp.]